MTELVRTVQTGSVGFDLVLGGGPRLLRRIANVDAESATLLLRGGPGAGKSVLATDIALRMGAAVHGDVLHVCIEILPREVIAQRAGFDGFDPATVIDLADPTARKSVREGPTLVIGMGEMTPAEGGDAPDLGGMILDLARISRERGCNPRVVVVDSLSDGYGLGASVPRPTVDGVCKLAVEQGWVLVLVEESVDHRASPWSFAVDTVLSLEVTPSGRRETRVTKHRFASCQPGPHRLLIEQEGVRVLPCFAAYRNAARDLVLPPPATNRSLRVPVEGTEPDWNEFAVPDDKGRVISVQINPKVPFSKVDNLVARIGRIAEDGSIQQGAFVWLHLAESYTAPSRWKASESMTRTLHQQIDGEEWLEAAISHISRLPGPIAGVQIGPTGSLSHYEHKESIRKAISLLAAILDGKEHLVVMYGMDADTVIRGWIIDEFWQLDPTPKSDPDRVQVRRAYTQTMTVTFEVALP